MTRPAKAASRLLLLLGIALSGVGGAAAATPRQAGPTTTPPPSISHLNNPSGHYTQDADGTVHARVYLAPIGLSPDPTQDSWHYRTAAVSAAPVGGALNVTGLPFALAVQQANPSADLTAEDGTALHLSLGTPGVTFQPAATPLTATSPITYTPANADMAPVSAVSWQPRFNGLLARVVIADATAPAPITLTMTPQANQNATISKDADGSIVVSHPQQVCGHAGCHTLTAPAFSILPPTLESPGDLAATGGASLFTLSLAAGALTLTANPGALGQIASHAPVTVDIPIETAAARAESGTFAPISSCVAADVVPSAKVLVGTDGNCQERAVLYFDVQQLIYLDQFTLTNATLHLYSPDTTGPTGVSVVPNAPGMMLPPPPAPGPHPTTFPAPANPPNTQVPVLPTPPAIQGHGPVTWSSAPTVESAAPSLQASTDAGNWHSWNLTSEVGAWMTRNQTNTGITLEGSSLPVRFASPFDPANADLATTPYLDVTLTKSQATQSGMTANSVPICTTTCTYSDGSVYPVGVNGENDPSPQGSGTSNNLMALADQTLNAGLYRFSAEANLEPPGSAPSYISVVPCTNFTYSPSLWQGAYIQMQNAYAHHLIPVVVFQQQPNACFNGYGNETTDWFDLLQYFSYYMPNFGTVCVGSTCTTNPPMYFEIGNEPDVPFASEYANKWTSIYPADFEIGSQGLYLWLNYPTNGTGHPAYSNVHILTAGMDAPGDGQCGWTNLNTMGDALYYATYYGTNPVPQQFLGTAVHPYGYMTAEQETGYWQNSDNFEINTICTNLDDVISYWRIEMNTVLDTQSQAPLLISEINFTSVPCLPEYDTIEREGPYQMDLYTWLYDHLGYYSWGMFPVRTLWFQEMDDISGNCVGGSSPQYLGLYGSGSGGGSPNYKVLQSPYFVGAGHYIPYTCPALFGSGNTNWTADLNSLADMLAYEPCY